MRLLHERMQFLPQNGVWVEEVIEDDPEHKIKTSSKKEVSKNRDGRSEKVCVLVFSAARPKPCRRESGDGRWNPAAERT